MPPKRDVECTCQYCGKLFTKRPSEIRKGEGKFCSKECGHKSRIKERPTKICSFCGKEYISRHESSQFCSVDCSHKGREIPNKKIAVIPCEFCGKEFQQERSTQRFCSHKCSHASVTTKVEKICPICNDKFKVKKCFDETAVTCSNKCLAKLKSITMIGNQLALGMKHTEETKEHLSKVFKEKFQDHDYAERQFELWGAKPNKLETLFDDNTSKDVVYKGDGKFFLTFKNGKVKNPDFVVAHQRKVIELFGDYWHRGEDPEELISQYREIGFECLVIWESEIKKNLPQVLLRVEEFVLSR